MIATALYRDKHEFGIKIKPHLEWQVSVLGFEVCFLLMMPVPPSFLLCLSLIDAFFLFLPNPPSLLLCLSLPVSVSVCVFPCVALLLPSPAVRPSFALSVAVFDFGCLHLGSNWTGAAPGKVSPPSLRARFAARHYPDQLGFSLFLSLFSWSFVFLLTVF